MKVFRPGETLINEEESLFLAGPSPRSPEVPSWRPMALEILYSKGFRGTVISPEPFIGHDRWEEQVIWELGGLDLATVIAFWIPRNMETMVGLTTNVEFGMYLNSKKFVLGYPVDAPKCRYLGWHSERVGAPVVHTLEDTMQVAINMVATPEWAGL